MACLDERVVGHVMVTVATLSDGFFEHRVASLSPLSVDPDQGRGIGSSLVRAVMPNPPVYPAAFDVLGH